MIGIGVSEAPTGEALAVIKRQDSSRALES